MNPRLVATGIGGGLLGTAALFFPLYLVLPQLYSRSWSDVDPFFGYLGLVGAALALFGTGFIAVRTSHSHSNRRRIQAGALAGLLAAMIAFCLIGAAAAGVAGNGPVYRHGLRAVGSPEKLGQLVAETVVRITWYTYLTFWGMLFAGASLAALGAWFSSGRNFSHRNNLRIEAEIAVEGPAAMFVLLFTALMALLQIPVLSAIAENVTHSLGAYSDNAGLWGRSILDWPLVTNLLLLAGTMWWCWSIIAGRWQHRVKRVKRFADLLAFFSVFGVTLTMGLIYYLLHDLYQDPVFLSAAGLVLIVTMVSIRKAKEAPPLDIPDEESARDSFGDRFGQSKIIAVLVPTHFLAGGVSIAVSLGLGVVVFLEVLQNGPVPVVNLPSVEESMELIFQDHWIWSLTISGAVSIGITLSIFAAVFDRWVATRRQNPRK